MISSLENWQYMDCLRKHYVPVFTDSNKPFSFFLFLQTAINCVCECLYIRCTLSLKYRYPQGSVLRLLPFSTDINDLNLFIKACCELFADDTTILSSMSRCHYKRANSSLLEWAEFYQMSLIFIRPNLSLSQTGKETKFKFKLSTYFHPSPNCK